MNRIVKATDEKKSFEFFNKIRWPYKIRKDSSVGKGIETKSVMFENSKTIEVKVKENIIKSIKTIIVKSKTGRIDENKWMIGKKKE